ncbi:MAG: PKD domain-containing protein [Bacteroidetes bacterium]|nr:PKD domain-containing protein [Bacteroidota bacterium]
MNIRLLCLMTVLLLSCEYLFAQAPPNDNCGNASFVYLDPTGNTCFSDNNTTGTGDGISNTCDAAAIPPLPAGGHEIWYSYVASGTVNTISVSPSGATPAEKLSITVLTGNCSSPGVVNVCNTAATTFDPASVAFTAAAGTQIWFYVTALEDDGEFLVCISSTNGFINPALTCTNASPICNTYDFTSPGSGQPGTSPVPSCFNSPPVRPFWYKFTVGYNGPLEFTGFPTNIGGFRWALYDITLGCPGTEVACNSFYDPFLPFGMSSFAVNCTSSPACPPINVTSGNTYALMLDDTSQSNSGFDFNWGTGVLLLPTANFSVDSLIACGSLTADFTVSGAYNASTNWSFNFGDGSPVATGNGTNLVIPSHTYGPGTYLTRLTLTQPTGCSHTFSRQIVVKPKPIASFTISDDSLCFDGTNPVSADFTANSTSSLLFYDWIFPNNSGVLINGFGLANATWNVSGNIPVGLQITENGCASDTITDTLHIIAIPTANFSLPDTGCTGVDVNVVYSGSAAATATYAWTYGGGTVTTPSNTQFDISWNTPGTYTLSLAIEENGCLGFSYTDSIRIFNTPIVNFNAPVKICQGETITLTPLATGAPIGSIYTWDFGNATLLGGNPGDGSSGTLQWSVAGATYVSVAVLSPEGCLSAVDSTPLLVNALPDANFTISDHQLCGDDSTVFTYTGLSPAATTNFTFEFGGANILNASSTLPWGPFHLNYNSAGTYPIYIVANDNVCNSDTIRDTIFVTDYPISNAGANQQICAGQGIGIGTTPTAGYTYSWTPAQYLSAPLASNPIATVPIFGTTDTLVKFIVTTSQGFCSLNDTMELSVTAVQQAFFLPPDPQCFEGNSFDFAPYFGVVPGTSQTWIIAGDTISSAQVQNYSFPTSGLQTISLQTQTPGCPDDFYSAFVIIKPNPVVAIDANIISGCAPLDVTFQDLSPTIPGATHLWTFGDGIVSFLNNPVHTYSNPGTYLPTLTLTSADTCSTTDTLNTPITVYPASDATFLAQPLIASNLNPDFNFAAVVGSTDCYFDFGDGTGDSSCVASHSYNDVGTYTVTLYTTNAGGCKDTFSLTVEVRPNFSLYIPNAFTPNNDQKNDLFQVVAEGVQNFEIQVYNRRGQVVWESDNLIESWNGEYFNDGTECPSGIYVYEASARDFNRKKYKFRGRITIIR